MWIRIKLTQEDERFDQFMLVNADQLNEIRISQLSAMRGREMPAVIGTGLDQITLYVPDHETFEERIQACQQVVEYIDFCLSSGEARCDLTKSAPFAQEQDDAREDSR